MTIETSGSGRTDLLSVARAAQRLDVCEETIRRRIRSGELVGVKLGHRTVRVTEESVSAYITARIMRPTTGPDGVYLGRVSM